MDSWKHCPKCNVEMKNAGGYWLCQCGRVWSRPDLEIIYNAERDAARLAAVRELVMEAVYARDHDAHQPQFNNALEALAAVWPEVLEG